MRLLLSKPRLFVVVAIALLAAAAVAAALPRLSRMTPEAEAPNSPQNTSVRGDLDGDGDVDQNDLNIVLAARNTKASGPNDARDLNKDGKIDGLDARVITTLCTRTRCAIESVTWSQPQIEVILSPGQTTTKPVSFAIDANLQNIVIEAVPELAGFLSIQPNTFANVPANQPQQVTLNLAIPTDATFGTFEGTIHVRSGSHTVPATLKVVMNVWKRFSDTALDVELSFPPEFRLSNTSPVLGESVYLSNSPTSGQEGGFDVPLGCNVDLSVEVNSQNTSLSQWVRENVRHDGRDATVVADGLTGIRKEFVGDITGDAAVLYAFSEGTRVYLFSAVGPSCVSVLDRIVSTLSF